MNPDQPDQNQIPNPVPVTSPFSAPVHGTETDSVNAEQTRPVEDFVRPAGEELEPIIDSKLGTNVVVSPQFKNDQGPVSPIPPASVTFPNDPETLRTTLPQAKKDASGKVEHGKTWIGKLTQFVVGKLLMRQPA